MQDRQDTIRSTRRNGPLFAILTAGVVVVLMVVGVGYSTGEWSREATRVGNDGAGLHVPGPNTATQPPATGAVVPR